MAFFNSAVTVLQTLVVALGAGLGIWGAINLLEGYGNDNPGAKSQGIEVADGWRRCRSHRHYPGAFSFRPVRLITPERDAGSVPQAYIVGDILELKGESTTMELTRRTLRCF